jgi:hypothetical protein
MEENMKNQNVYRLERVGAPTAGGTIKDLRDEVLEIARALWARNPESQEAERLLEVSWKLEDLESTLWRISRQVCDPHRVELAGLLSDYAFDTVI